MYERNTGINFAISDQRLRLSIGPHISGRSIWKTKMVITIANIPSDSDLVYCGS
jgi:hypothetical protein